MLLSKREFEERKKDWEKAFLKTCDGDPKTFPEANYRMEELVSECKSMNKKVILHTYMDYDMDAFGDSKHVFLPSDYDNILKNVAKKYSNAFYVDMSDYNNKIFLQPDLIHYNQVFYDELYSRIRVALMLF